MFVACLYIPPNFGPPGGLQVAVLFTDTFTTGSFYTALLLVVAVVLMTVRKGSPKCQIPVSSRLFHASDFAASHCPSITYSPSAIMMI